MHPLLLGDNLKYDTYLRFLLSDYNISSHHDHFILKKEDMYKPLSHYFINSSHNTYLKGYLILRFEIPFLSSKYF